VTQREPVLAPRLYSSTQVLKYSCTHTHTHRFVEGSDTSSGLSPYALQQRVVLGEMAGQIKALLLRVAYEQVRTVHVSSFSCLVFDEACV